MLLAHLASFPAYAQALATPLFPGASAVGLVPPEGMAPSESFAGFEHSSGASIVLADLPAEAYDAVVARFTPDGFRPSGFIMAGDSEPISVGGIEGRLARGSQNAHGVRFRKWVVILRGPDITGMVTVQVPEGRNEISDAEVEAALRTIALRPVQSVENQLAASPYTIGDLAGFRIVRSLLGSGLLLTDGPKDSDPESDQAMVVLAHSLGAAWTAGQELAFARNAAADIAGLEAITITREQRSEGSLKVAVQHRGQAKDVRSSRPVLFAQTILFHGSGYLRVIAIAPPERAEALDRADRLANSVSMRGEGASGDGGGHQPSVPLFR